MLVISLILILLSNALLFASAVWQTAGKKVLTRKYMNKIIIIIKKGDKQPKTIGSRGNKMKIRKVT